MNTNEIAEYFNAAGIKINTDIIDFNSEKEGYTKIDDDIAAHLDILMQGIPDIIYHANTKDAYHVIYDKGIGALQKSVQYPGYYLGGIVNPQTNTGYKDMALLHPFSVGSQLVSSVFSVLSIATGQYYMSQINNKMEHLAVGISKVQQYLSDDKKSHLQSEEEFLKFTQLNMQYLITNNYQKTATITTLQKIRIDSLGAIKLYRKQIIDLKKEAKKKDNADEVVAKVTEICTMVSEYWYSLYLYCYSIMLETILSQNIAENYLNNVADDISEKCNNYKCDYKLWHDELNDYINNANGFDENAILAILTKFKGTTKGLNNNITAIVVANVIGFGAELLDKQDKKKKTSKKNIAHSKVGQNFGQDITIIEEMKNNILLYNSIYNKPVEISKQNGDMYIKLSIYLENKN